MGNLVKKTGLVFAAFGLASTAFAGSYSEGCNCEVTIPKFAGGIRVGVEALYMGVDVKDTLYGLSYHNTLGASTFRGHSVDSDYDWGWGVELAYVRAGTGNDFVINYSTLHNESSDHINQNFGGSSEIHGFATGFIVGWTNQDDDFGDPAMSDSEGLDSLNQAHGHVEVDYMKIDAEAGQTVKLGRDSVCLRFHYGMRYADLDTKQTIALRDNFDEPDGSARFKTESSFDGLGPRFGVDGAWHVGNGFSFIAEVSAALLVGTVESTWKYEDTADNQLPIQFSASYRESNDHQVVPNLEGRLGVNYRHHFSNSSEMNLQVGYHVGNYFDVDNRLFNHGTDVGMYGLYAKADYMI